MNSIFVTGYSKTIALIMVEQCRTMLATKINFSHIVFVHENA